MSIHGPRKIKEKTTHNKHTQEDLRKTFYDYLSVAQKKEWETKVHNTLGFGSCFLDSPLMRLAVERLITDAIIVKLGKDKWV